MIDEGALENPKVDAVMGLHVGNLTDNAKEGIIMVSYDSMMACLDRFRVKLIGKGCHGAYPETGIDPVAMAGYFLTNLQAIVSREIGATDPAVITVGKINGGFAYNIIPDSVELEGTVRAVDQSVREYIANRIEDLAKGISETWIDIINAVNSIAMNRYIIRINDRKNADRLQLRSDNFRKKIETIVANLSEEINYPISIIDVLENKIFNYPNKDFSLKEDISYLKGEDFPFNYQKEILGDRLNIYRITNIEEKDMWSFIVMPIVLKGVTVSKLIVWEDQGEVDYYDLFSLRLTYILLLEVYEQIYLMNSFERRFYDDLIKSLIDGEIDTKQKLIKSITSIEDFKLDIDSRFTAIFNDRSKGL
ncbi:MAG: amidohydrolase [Tissierellia bacterium]|nr:amidohydrolase [Tissierellia bacterium]